MYELLAYARFVGFKGEYSVLDELSDVAFQRYSGINNGTDV